MDMDHSDLAYLAVAEVEMRVLRGEPVTAALIFDVLHNQAPDLQLDVWTKALVPVLQEQGYTVELTSALTGFTDLEAGARPARGVVASAWLAIGVALAAFWTGVAVLVSHAL